MEVLDAPTADAATDHEFDDAFLASVDRAMRMSKQLDPLRLDQVQRAAEHEIRMNRTGGF
jgi:hypothetical protein